MSPGEKLTAHFPQSLHTTGSHPSTLQGCLPFSDYSHIPLRRFSSCPAFLLRIDPQLQLQHEIPFSFLTPSLSSAQTQPPSLSLSVSQSVMLSGFSCFFFFLSPPSPGVCRRVKTCPERGRGEDRRAAADRWEELPKGSRFTCRTIMETLQTKAARSGTAAEHKRTLFDSSSNKNAIFSHSFTFF